ncbi:MAG: hypothetical protein RL693_2344 [Verrucomicrobiota bacterium]|jgi:ankyrin repeat protein
MQQYRTFHDVLISFADDQNLVFDHLPYVCDPVYRGGDTALHVAIYKKDLKAFELLLAACENLDIKGEDGMTPLHAAVSAGMIGCVSMLLNRGAALNVADENGDVPLDLVNYLLEQGESSDEVIRIEQMLSKHKT